jgi:thioester reductase-like protein
LRSITTSLENLQRDHKEMMHQFVRRDDYKSALERIEQILTRIWDKLDEKADK